MHREGIGRRGFSLSGNRVKYSPGGTFQRDREGSTTEFTHISGQLAGPFVVAPTQPAGVESLTVHQEDFFERFRPARFDKLQITAFVRSVDFVSDDGKSRIGRVDTDLVHPTSQGITAED